ncbi:hypothetical protein FH972_021908 [Carpinus fangiana]|uniref:Cwf19-like C-terminal domain-containing protein n=1 Tax=Carpinus fangiana TaxID=176857 RepID=A0A5N6KR22_9ROSI|nr:hypothetical protein FH972_021908 [Carpinus fangiana]
MALEDFEKELTEQRSERNKRKREKSSSPHRARHHRHLHHHHHHDHSHASHHRKSSHEKEEERQKGRHQRTKDREGDLQLKQEHHHSHFDNGKHSQHNRTTDEHSSISAPGNNSYTRDTWMQAPSAMDVDFVRRVEQRAPRPQYVKALDVADTLVINHDEIVEEDSLTGLNQYSSTSNPAPHEVPYTFGDAGSAWRMTKLQATYRLAKDSGRALEDVAVDRHGDLRSFDDAREEEIEMSRRERYGKNYVGKKKPVGSLFQERQANVASIHTLQERGGNNKSEEIQGKGLETESTASTTTMLDQTVLNKLKAQMMKAKLRRAANAERLETEYNEAASRFAQRKGPDLVVLNKMESRLLTGGRDGEMKNVETKRGRERQLVEENEDMSVEDMVRNERRTRGELGGEGKAFAERIVRDTKFDNDLDYMDENASKLAKTAQKSEINLRSTAIGEYQKMKHILDTCPLCHHEDTGKAPQAPLVSLAMRTFLTLPTGPEITPYGLCASIVPTQHRLNLLECDDDEWEEIRNFMKSLTRFYWSRTPRMSVIFYENAAHLGRKRHASMEAVPLPVDLAGAASAFFKEAILVADEEWSQHRKVIDTLMKANDGLGKLAFRRSMVANLPYFHVWLSLDGGMGHVVEDTRKWPKGDLFAREVIGGMLDVSTEIIKRQGHWRLGDLDMERRVRDFGKSWEKWDWTKALLDAE